MPVADFQTYTKMLDRAREAVADLRGNGRTMFAS